MKQRPTTAPSLNRRCRPPYSRIILMKGRDYCQRHNHVMGFEHIERLKATKTRLAQKQTLPEQKQRKHTTSDRERGTRTYTDKQSNIAHCDQRRVWQLSLSAPWGADLTESLWAAPVRAKGAPENTMSTIPRHTTTRVAHSCCMAFSRRGIRHPGYSVCSLVNNERSVSFFWFDDPSTKWNRHCEYGTTTTVVR